MRCLLRIVVGEQDLPHSQGVYDWVKTFLWKEGLPGLTIRRGEMSLDYRGMVHAPVLADTECNDLPVILESITDMDTVNRIKPELMRQLPHGQISVVHGVEEAGMETSDYFVVKIYTKQQNSWFKESEYDKALRFLQNKGVIWATITKGVAGYGKDHVIHKQSFFSLSEQLPVVVECIVPAQSIQGLLDHLKKVVTEGAVFTKTVDLIQNA